MHFIEQWLHVSPDGGSGTLEIMLCFVPVLAIAAAEACFRRAPAREARGSRAHGESKAH